MLSVTWGTRPPLDFSKMAEPPTEPWVRLALRCKACGRERSYVFPKVYYDIGTERVETKAAQYDPVFTTATGGVQQVWGR